MQTIRLGALAVTLVAVTLLGSACTGIDDAPDHETAATTGPFGGEVDGDGDGTDSGTGIVAETGGSGCGEIHDVATCAAAGCVPLEVLPLVVDDQHEATACQIGESVVICSPPEESTACDEDARVCADQFTWVMPLPDGGAFIAHVDVSCDLPDTFMACPAAPSDPSGGTATSGSGTTDGDGSDPDPVAVACDCACA